MARTAQTDDTTPTLYVALELSKETWKLGFTTSRTQRARIRDVPGRDTARLLEEIAAAKERFELPADVPVRSCYEAGRDGFWIHHFLGANGITNVIVEPASIQVDRRAKQVKTDRVDVQKLAQILVRHHEGEEVVRVVRVPPPATEDERLLPRQLRRLKKARAQVTNAMRAGLFRHGVDLDPRASDYRERLKAARQWSGDPLPRGLLRELEFLRKQLALLEAQVKQLEQEQRKALKAARRGAEDATPAQMQAARLSELKGIGDVGAYTLTTEFFSWREFRNRKEVGALAGLTGTPFSSGSEQRDQGISKAGNPRVRTLMVELSWLWLRFQPDSELTRWFHHYVGKGGGSRGKRKAIVALARKLLIALWHYLEHGVVPGGARLKTTPLGAAA